MTQSPPHYRIKSARVDNEQLAHDLIARIFGQNRFDRTINKMRKTCQPMPDLAFHAYDEKSQLLGLVHFYAAHISQHDAIIPVLGPLAIEPECRGFGVGRSLVKQGMQAAKQQGFAAVLIVGSPDYFGPLGFQQNLADHITLSGPVAPLVLMGQNIYPNFLQKMQGPLRFI